MNNTTPESGIDLRKIRDVRRALRRRYIRCKNFNRIFTAWDRESKGRISVQNVYTMLKLMNMPLSKAEANVLLASADRTKAGELAPAEFMDMIFNQDNILDLDLKKVNLDFSKVKDQDQEHFAIKLMQEDAEKARR